MSMPAASGAPPTSRPRGRRRPHGQELRAADRGRRVPRHRPAAHPRRRRGSGLVCYDPGLFNTAACKSRITFVDGERGILRYRGYAIEELAEKSTYLEVAYLIVKGELPDRERLAMWTRNVTVHPRCTRTSRSSWRGFATTRHPMGMLAGTLGALSTFYPDAAQVLDAESRRLQTRRLIGKLPTLAAYAYRRSRGLPTSIPTTSSRYVGNFLSMVFRRSGRAIAPDPVIERALDVLFLLHADHEQNCSTNALRCVASAHADPYSAVAAAVAALGGPRHGGANEAVVRMFERDRLARARAARRSRSSRPATGG